MMIILDEINQIHSKLNPKAHLLVRSLTALMSDLKLISPMLLYCASSHRTNLLDGYLGFFPPPTNPKILHLQSISMIPMPPPKSTKRNIKTSRFFNRKPLEKVSMQGWVQQILNPFSVPHAKQPFNSKRFMIYKEIMRTFILIKCHVQDFIGLWVKCIGQHVNFFSNGTSSKIELILKRVFVNKNKT